jgi:hypothetical protein
MFKKIANHLFSKGADPVPPRTAPCALRWYCITFSGIIAPEGMPQRQGEALHAVAPQERLRKILWISAEPRNPKNRKKSLKNDERLIQQWLKVALLQSRYAS